MKLNILRKAFFATIDTSGAALSSLTLHGEPLLGTGKENAGGFPAFPYYGPAPGHDGPRHGYARTMEWDIEELGMDRIKLVLPRGVGEYEKFYLAQSYQLTEHGIRLLLEVENRGEKALPVAPGFHLLHLLSKGEWNIRLDGEIIPVNSLEGMDFREGGKTLRLKNRRLEMETDRLSMMALWSDGKYLSCDPTAQGVAFFKQSEEIEHLKPKSRRQYRFHLTFWDY